MVAECIKVMQVVSSLGNWLERKGWGWRWGGCCSAASLEPFAISAVALLPSPQTTKQQNIGETPLDSLRLKRAVITFSAHISSLQLSTTRRSFYFTLPPGDLLDWNKHLFRLVLWVIVSLFVTVIKVIDMGASGNNRVKATSCPSYRMF